jgi:hypothetical protein
MNKISIIYILILCFGCKTLDIRKEVKSKNTIIEGSWNQVMIIAYGEPNHQVGPVEWQFAHDKCKIAIKNPREYGVKISKNTIEFLPLKGIKYYEYEEKLIFNRFSIEQNDSEMLLTCLDSIRIQIIFKRDSSLNR